MKKLTAVEFEAIKTKCLTIADEPILELEFPDMDLDFDMSKIPATPPGTCSAPSLPPARGSRKISIRIPARTLSVFKEQAAAIKIPYQRLINRTLKAAVADWGSL